MSSFTSHDLAMLLVPPGSTVADLGCGSGRASRRLADRGCRVTAVDITFDPDAWDSVDGVHLVEHDLTAGGLEPALGGERFDVVVMLDVLEHLPDPLSVLQEAATLLRDGGTMVLSIPNITHGAVRLAMAAGEFRYRDEGLLDRTHIRFFDWESVVGLLADAKLELVDRYDVHRDLDATEVPIPPETPDALRAYVASDPESTVYQWVLRVAGPGENPDPVPDVGPVLAEIQASHAAWADAAAYARTLEQRIAELEAVVGELEDARVAADTARQQAEGFEHDLVRRAEELGVARRDLRAARREIESLDDQVAAAIARIEQLEALEATVESLRDERDLALSRADRADAQVAATTSRVGYQAMDRVAINPASRAALLFRLGRRVAAAISRRPRDRR